MSKIIEDSIIIDAPADEVWRIASEEYHKVGEWSSSLLFSAPNNDVPIPEGATVGGRVCSAPGFGDVRETIIRFDPAKKSFTYRVDGLPGFVTQMDNTWTMTPVGDRRTKFTIRAEMDTNAFPGALMGPVMKRKLAGAIDVFNSEFKLWVEKREISDAKRKLNAKQAKKKQAA